MKNSCHLKGKLAEAVIEDTGYIESLSQNETVEEVEARRENLDEFINKVVSYGEGCQGSR